MQNNINDIPDMTILEHIKTEALADAPKPDFEDLKQRVASLSETKDTAGGFGYRDMFPEEKKQPVTRIALRYAAAAAAIVATVGIGAAAAGNIISSSKSDEMSYSAGIYEETMEIQDDYPDEAAEASPEAPLNYTETDTEADGAAFEDAAESMLPFAEDDTSAAVTSEEPAANAGEEDVAFDGINDENTVFNTVSASSETPSQNSTAVSDDEEELYDFYVRDLGMTLGVPYQAFCTGPDVPDNFPPLERFGITAEQLESNYKSRGICFNAVWYDDGADVVEIVVSSEDVSNTINNLSSLSEYELEQMRQSFLRYGIDSPDSPRYYDVSVVSVKGQPYIRALGKDYAGKACHAQYMTIVNGKRIKLSLIEHFNGEDPLPEEGVSAAHVRLMDSVAASIRYDHIRSQFAYRLSRLRPTVWVSLLGIIILIIYGIHELIERKKHPAGETSQSDAADIYDYEIENEGEDDLIEDMNDNGGTGSGDECESDDSCGDSISEYAEDKHENGDSGSISECSEDKRENEQSGSDNRASGSDDENMG